MKCYYEELGIERDADASTIKVAYRKLALKWHPDKNPSCKEEAKERFQLIQQAYEVLQDPQERAWYDNHREQILRGKNSEYQDRCLDVFQYFTVSCFKGYGNDSKGFYAVYREVFRKLAAEDAEFMIDEEELIHIPEFGDSNSSYADVVGPFYAYWSAYCTRRTYTWLCPYDVREVKDRKILREIEKDMKKVVQKAKKERNEEVRSLVSFIRKRDKRVQAYKKVLEERSTLNRQKHEQNRLEHLRRRKKELEEIRKNSQIAIEGNDDYEEKLKLLELEYSSDEEVYEDDSMEQSSFDNLYCVACNKDFKTDKAFANHEISKKHRDNIEGLKIEMQSEENLYQQKAISDEEELIETEVSDGEVERNTLESTESHKISTIKNELSNKKHNKDFKKVKQPILLNCERDLKEENLEGVTDQFCPLHNDKDDTDWNTTKRKFKNKNKSNRNKSALSEQKPVDTKVELEHANKSGSALGSELTHICATCKSKFESKNKLFSHLKLTNHGVFIPKANEEEMKTRKGKKK